MLHTKFQGHRLLGSRERRFSKVFTIYGHGGHLGHVTQPFEGIFVPPTHIGST